MHWSAPGKEYRPLPHWMQFTRPGSGANSPLRHGWQLPGIPKWPVAHKQPFPFGANISVSGLHTGDMDLTKIGDTAKGFPEARIVRGMFPSSRTSTMTCLTTESPKRMRTLAAQALPHRVLPSTSHHQGHPHAQTNYWLNQRTQQRCARRHGVWDCRSDRVHE